MAFVRMVWAMAGLVAVGLGAAGVVLPLLPTTPFMLVAAFCFARSSPRLHRWLMEHRLFGPAIVNWRRHGAIDRRSKILATGFCAVALLLSSVAGLSMAVLTMQFIILACVMLFIWTRPDAPDG